MSYHKTPINPLIERSTAYMILFKYSRDKYYGITTISFGLSGY